MSNFVILGANGVLGSSLYKDLIAAKHKVVGFTRENLNINDFDAMKSMLRKYADSVIINCIAFMPADKCEKDSRTSKLVNVDF